jgi:hypothetical protein
MIQIGADLNKLNKEGKNIFYYLGKKDIITTLIDKKMSVFKLKIAI